MKPMRLVMIALALSALAASVAGAQTATPRIDRREARQHQRIRQGRRSGELTRGEQVRLRAGQRHIRRMEMRAKRDGRVTPMERRRITRARNRESRRIGRLKHNGRSRTL